MKKYVLLLPILFLIQFCSTQKEMDKKTDSKARMFIENKWYLLDEEGQFEGINNQKVYFEYNPETKAINGFGGCNTFFGNSFSQTENTINFGEMAVTKKYCPNSNDERLLLNLLKETNNYTIENNILNLYKDKLLLLKFSKEN